VRNGKKLLTNKKHMKQLERYAYSSLSGLTLDREDVHNFAFRAMGAGIWALRKYARADNRDNIVQRIILNIILEGGDADCNAAIAGALIGTYAGYKALPKTWVKCLPHRDWMDDMVDKYTDALLYKDPEPDDTKYRDRMTQVEYSDSEGFSGSYSDDSGSYSDDSYDSDDSNPKNKIDRVGYASDADSTEEY